MKILVRPWCLSAPVTCSKGAVISLEAVHLYRVVPIQSHLVELLPRRLLKQQMLKTNCTASEPSLPPSSPVSLALIAEEAQLSALIELSQPSAPPLLILPDSFRLSFVSKRRQDRFSTERLRSCSLPVDQCELKNPALSVEKVLARRPRRVYVRHARYCGLHPVISQSAAV